MFTAILGLGFLTFLAIYFLLNPFRLAIVALAGFLFSGLFMLIGKGVTPLIDWFITKFDEARARHLEQSEEESFFIDFSLRDEVRIFGATFSNTELFIMVGIFIITLVAFILIARRRKKRSCCIKTLVTHSDQAEGKRAKRKNNLFMITPRLFIYCQNCV